MLVVTDSNTNTIATELVETIGNYDVFDGNLLRDELNREYQVNPDGSILLYVPRNLGRLAVLPHIDPEHKITFFDNRIILDTAGREAYLDEGDVGATKLEFELLSLLGRMARTAVESTRIGRAIWGSRGLYYRSGNIKSHIYNLRMKTDSAAIETVHGIGYRAAR